MRREYGCLSGGSYATFVFKGEFLQKNCAKNLSSGADSSSSYIKLITNK